jgi:hypothetical protein
MSAPDPDNKQRNREIAQNEAERHTTGDMRVSLWVIAVTIIFGVIAFALAWAWLNR